MKLLEAFAVAATTLAPLGLARHTILTQDPRYCKLPAAPGINLGGGFFDKAACTPSTGDVTASMIFVDFPDATEGPGTAAFIADTLLPATVNWYANASLGRMRLRVQADTHAFARMPRPAASYGLQRGYTEAKQRAYIEDALDAYTRDARRPPPRADVLLIVPAPDAAGNDTSAAYMREVLTRGGARVAGKAVTFGHDLFDGHNFDYKVLVHEMGHCICLPDYYSTAGGPDVSRSVGGWSLMSEIGALSPDFFAWDKWRLGWLDDAQIDCVATEVTGPGSSSHVLSPAGDTATGGPKAIVVKRSATTALVAEVRSARGSDWESCAGPGVLLYQVRTDVVSGQGPVVVLDANPGSNGCNGRPLGDALLTLSGGGASQYTSHELGVRVTLQAQQGETFWLEVDAW